MKLQIPTVTALAVLVLSSLALAQEKLAVKGSDTLGAKMLPRLIEAYQTAGNQVTFEIEDKGSSTAFTNLLGGTADIGMSSRQVKDNEVEMFAAKGQELVEHVAAIDMIAIIVNEKNPISSLSLEEIEGIFTGEISDWSEVGGVPGSISTYTRNEQSGTYKTFQKLGMAQRDYGSNTQKMEGNEPIASEVADNSAGIGYVGLAYAGKSGVKAVAVEDVLPVPSNKDEYKLARKLFYYTVGQPTGAAEKFLGWIASDEEAQEVISKVGFIPNKPVAALSN